MVDSPAPSTRVEKFLGVDSEHGIERIDRTASSACHATPPRFVFSVELWVRTSSSIEPPARLEAGRFAAGLSLRLAHHRLPFRSATAARGQEISLISSPAGHSLRSSEALARDSSAVHFWCGRKKSLAARKHPFFKHPGRARQHQAVRRPPSRCNPSLAPGVSTRRGGLPSAVGEKDERKQTNAAGADCAGGHRGGIIGRAAAADRGGAICSRCRRWVIEAGLQPGNLQEQAVASAPGCSELPASSGLPQTHRAQVFCLPGNSSQHQGRKIPLQDARPGPGQFCGSPCRLMKASRIAAHAFSSCPVADVDRQGRVAHATQRLCCCQRG